MVNDYTGSMPDSAPDPIVPVACAPNPGRLYRPAAGTQSLAADHPIAYPDAVTFMETRADQIRAGSAPEAIWLVEHPPLYTAGTSADPAELVDPDRLPVFQSARGGRYTYHGPGQRVAYVMLDLKARGGDLRAFVGALEAWVINTLAAFGVKGEIRCGRVGVWVNLPGGMEAKIAAIGIRVRRMVSYHGISINVAPDLDHFSGIVPCGIADHGVTSLKAIGLTVSMADLDLELMRQFGEIFGPCDQR